MEFTQEQLNILGFNYKCCFSQKGEDLVKSIQMQGKDCICETKKLLFLEMLTNIVNCYTLGKEVQHRNEVQAYPTTWLVTFNVVFFIEDIQVSIQEEGNPFSIFLGEGITIAELVNSININGTGFTAENVDPLNPNKYLLTSPPGYYSEGSLNQILPPGIEITNLVYEPGLDYIPPYIVEYTTEELNCLDLNQLNNIIEYINKQCDCCI